MPEVGGGEPVPKQPNYRLKNVLKPWRRVKDAVKSSINFELKGKLTRVQKLQRNAAFNAAVTIDRKLQVVEKNSIIDPLTGMFNKRAFDIDLEARTEEARRNRKEILMGVMTDIDDFGPINVIYNQLIGDKVLIEVAKRVHGARVADRSYRVGGEEMVVLMPSLPLEARKINGRPHENPGDRIRRQIENTDFPALEGLGRVKEKMTISVGMAEFDNRGDTAETFYTRLSNAAKIAKMLGKNRTVVATLKNMGKVKIESYLDLKTGKTYRYNKLFDNPEKPEQFKEFLTDNTTSEKFEVVQDEAKKEKPKLVLVP